MCGGDPKGAADDGGGREEPLLRAVRSFPSLRLYSLPPGTINAAPSGELVGVSQGVFITVGEGGREAIRGWDHG